ncbi:hypothetical protein N7495_006121 [Penicillium taxi]|uniref:uncharacterized protein n=1 Tax=Penicillium taxi TaxID=168475 RepID=UPI002545A57E|nr:uncharacterized protein N7495_006121 [Penicillium taxi]KAJ5894430.1 hypothetical protein N7495_006121 [Penicillium taxi]
MAISTDLSLSDCEMSMKTVRLEKEYEKAIADSARLVDAERDRMRRMENLLLQFESESLRSQLNQANMQLRGFTRTESETLLQLNEACQEIDHLNRQVQLSSNEIEKLKEDISTLNNTSTSYNTLLAEKLHLSRDITNLETENKRLKTQSSSHETSMTEKHEMEQRLNSLEVQLENEKHAHEGTRLKALQQEDDISELSNIVDNLKGELAREMRMRQQHERDDQQHNAEWESQRTVLEGKLETLKKQLRSTKDKLQETQLELQRRANTRPNEGDSSELRSRTVPIKRPGPSADYQSGITIATPGAIRLQEKVKKLSALPGDKSAFSITPFLNRTGAPRDSPTSSEVDEDEVQQAMADINASTATATALDKSNIIGTSSADSPSLARALPAKAAKSNYREAAITAISGSPDFKQPRSRPNSKFWESDKPTDSLESKSKKRKLGAQRDRNLFEDDEDERVESRKPGRKLALGVSRNSSLSISQQPGAPTGDRLPRTLGFGAFSPLKRDRK